MPLFTIKFQELLCQNCNDVVYHPNKTESEFSQDVLDVLKIAKASHVGTFIRYGLPTGIVQPHALVEFVVRKLGEKGYETSDNGTHDLFIAQDGEGYRHIISRVEQYKYVADKIAKR